MHLNDVTACIFVSMWNVGKSSALSKIGFHSIWPNVNAGQTKICVSVANMSTGGVERAAQSIRE